MLRVSLLSLLPLGLASTATCSIRSTSGSTAEGWFRLQDEAGGVRVTYSLQGLTADSSYTHHVHDLGSVFTDDGLSTGGHFIGYLNQTACSDANPCRPSGVLQEVGLLNDGQAIPVDGSGVAMNEYVDSVIELSGVNSVVGRSIVIHDPANARVGQCVIGLEDEQSLDSVGVEVTSAECRFEEVAGNNGNAVRGHAFFEETADALEVRLFVWGLSPGSHGVHVHTRANMTGDAGSAYTGGHFVGAGVDRGADYTPTGDRFNAGGLSDTGSSNVDLYSSSAHKTSMVRFVDTFARLNGDNSIVGRSLVIHGLDTDSGVRVAQCVIGISAYHSPYNVSLADVTRAVSTLTGLGHEVDGLVLMEGTLSGVTTRYMIKGFMPTEAISLGVHAFGDMDSVDGVATGALLHDLGLITPSEPNWTQGKTFTADEALSDWIGRGLSVAFDPRRVAQGVIGRMNDVHSTSDPGVSGTQAMCVLEGLDGASVDGTVHFIYDETETAMRVTTTIASSSLEVGTHNWHIHIWGDLMDRKWGQSVSGHYIGQPRNRDEIGQLNDNTPLTFTAGGAASVEYVEQDDVVLSGVNNVLGRSIIIHGLNPDASGARQAVCTIGLMEDEVYQTPKPTNSRSSVATTTPSTWSALLASTAVGVWAAWY